MQPEGSSRSDYDEDRSRKRHCCQASLEKASDPSSHEMITAVPSYSTISRSSSLQRQIASVIILFVVFFTESKGVSSYYSDYPSTMMGRHKYRRKDSLLQVRKPQSVAFGFTKLQASNRDADKGDDLPEQSDKLSRLESKLMRRVTRLEALVAKQAVEMHRLKKKAEQLTETAEAFARVLQLLRDSGLETDVPKGPKSDEKGGAADGKPEAETNPGKRSRVIESFDDSMIFGTAPSSVSDAADAAGAAILAAMLGGKHRMLIDVRDAELSSDSETLVQFIELAILPIAAGLEGLQSTRNRVKIVFPKVSQLLEYRRTMALAAPEVVALSTLGFDPIEKRDKLVVIVAPEPDDEEGLAAMEKLIHPSAGSQPIEQPVVILNYHMVPVEKLPIDFETAYHLRLLTVQYSSSSENFDEYFPDKKEAKKNGTVESQKSLDHNKEEREEDDAEEKSEDAALEAAMKHAHEVGMNQGVTRAMVIRAYPRPWHVFVDTSPDTDADFEVAATFDEEPTLDELNMAIVECLEGSEREDEIVAQQMQQALEDGQLDRVSDMIGEALNQYDENEYDDDVEGEEEDLS